MDYKNYLLIAVMALIILFCLQLYKKSGKFFRSLFLSAVSGTGGLFAVNLLSTVTSVSIPVTPVTAVFSCFSGLSGVISLVVWQVIFS